MIRGAVWAVDLGRPRGHEQGGRRPGLLVSPSDPPLPVVTVVPTSTSAGPAIHRPALDVAGWTTRFLVDQVRSIDVDHVHGDSAAFLDREEMAEVELTLAHYVGIQAMGTRPSTRPGARGTEGS